MNRFPYIKKDILFVLIILVILFLLALPLNPVGGLYSLLFYIFCVIWFVLLKKKISTNSSKFISFVRIISLYTGVGYIVSFGLPIFNGNALISLYGSLIGFVYALSMYYALTLLTLNKTKSKFYFYLPFIAFIGLFVSYFIISVIKIYYGY